MTSAPPGKRAVTLAVLSAGVVAYTIGQSLLGPVLPTLQAALHTSQTNVTWVLSCYLLSASVFTPIFGRLADAYGKKQMLVTGLIMLTLGSVLAAWASSLPTMIVARMIQGAGGGVLPISFGIVRDEYPAARVAGAVGIIAALSALGSGLGIVLAGPVVEHLGYHWLFWMPVAVTAVTALGAQLLVPRSPVTGQTKVNWLAALLLSGWLIALLLAVTQAPVWGWLTPRVLVLFAVAAAAAAWWVVLEARSQYPLIDMRMMRLRGVWTNNVVAFTLGTIMFVSFYFVPVFVQTPRSTGYGFGVSVTESGLMVLPQTMSIFVMGALCGRLTKRFGAKPLLVAAPLFCVCGFLLLTFSHEFTWEIYVATGIVGIGIGIAFSTSSSLMVSAVPMHQTGTALGMNANIRSIGGAVGSAVMASVIVAGSSPTRAPLESGFTHGFLMLAGAAVLCVAAAALVPGDHAPGRHSAARMVPIGLETTVTVAVDESLAQQTKLSDRQAAVD
jgi:EmrB/QacA subfamily drug resistance transporter